MKSTALTKPSASMTPAKAAAAGERIAKICLTLPETTEEVHGDHRTFRIGKAKKVFAYFLNNHHGDGIVSLCCKVAPGDNTWLANAQPARYYLPAYIGPRGWVGLRVDQGRIDWDEVSELVKDSYRRTAPAKLAVTVRVAE